jgi:uncharacterized protein YaeQ
MLRVLAFALHADEALTFTRGLSAEDEPDLWQKDLTGEIGLWIEVGQPDERRLRKACGRARKVVVYNYGERAAAIWWDKSAKDFAKLDNLSVYVVNDASVKALEAMAARTMRLSFTLQDGDVWVSDGVSNAQLVSSALKIAK